MMAQQTSDEEIKEVTETAKHFRRFASDLIDWQKQHGRHHLPWQLTREPYSVWLSEIMLQQTQVSTVLAYYQKFLNQFPSVEHLAQASLDEILALWSGLGYYSRARNLHQCAKVIMSEHNGVFPVEYKVLIELPGIGPSTAAAIAAFCFGERVSILDGNVRRVLTRLLGFKKDLSKSGAQHELWGIAQQLLPAKSYVRLHPDAMRSYTQGLMDLGAQVCLPRKAQCAICPVQKICVASKEGDPLIYPVKTKKLKRTTRAGYLLWLVSSLGVWLVLREKDGIWGGLYSMPVFETQYERDEFVKLLQIKKMEHLPRFKHVLTHLDWLLQATRVELNAAQAKKLPGLFKATQGNWYAVEQLDRLGLSAPIKKLLQKS